MPTPPDSSRCSIAVVVSQAFRIRAEHHTCVHTAVLLNGHDGLHPGQAAYWPPPPADCRQFSPSFESSVHSEADGGDY
jgi:hypothetical protein